MKVIVSGGGTGGHIYPAIAIIEELKKRYPNIEILYIGKNDSMEESIAKEMGLNFKPIRVSGLPRKINKKFFEAVVELFSGLRDANKHIKNFKPDLLVGTGGYVSGPVVFLGALRGHKTAIHEQNSYPGLTNRILGRFVNLILLTYKSSERFFKGRAKKVVTGNPIRASVNLKTPTEETYEKYKISKKLPLVFSFGGSNGSESLNNALVDILNKQGKNLGFNLIHATGKDNYNDFLEKINNKTFPGVSIEAYIYDIAEVYGLSDLIITSSGAITLAEISTMGLASILIPKAYTTENHQEFNARTYVEAGASEMILESDLNGDLLYNKIQTILKNQDSLKVMAENAKDLANPNSTNAVVDNIESLIKEG